METRLSLITRLDFTHAASKHSEPSPISANPINRERGISARFAGDVAVWWAAQCFSTGAGHRPDATRGSPYVEFPGWPANSHFAWLISFPIIRDQRQTSAGFRIEESLQ